MEAGVFTVDVDTAIDSEGVITITVNGDEAFRGSLVDAVAVQGAIGEVLQVSGFAGMSQAHQG